MSARIFQHTQYLDFHTHSMRHPNGGDIEEIVSLHLGKEKKHRYFTVGLHPWWTEEPVSPEQRIQLEILLADPFCLAMGEMGLDNLKGPVITRQMEILRSQLAIASECRKPVIIHCVRAYDQLIRIKKEFPEIPNWCIHGYGRHAILAKQLTDQGFYLSLMPGLPPAKYTDLVAAIPRGRWFLETDSMPDTSIETVYLQASNWANVELPELCRQLLSNARDFFRL